MIVTKLCQQICNVRDFTLIIVFNNIYRKTNISALLYTVWIFMEHLLCPVTFDWLLSCDVWLAVTKIKMRRMVRVTQWIGHVICYQWKSVRCEFESCQKAPVVALARTVTIIDQYWLVSGTLTVLWQICINVESVSLN